MAWKFYLIKGITVKQAIDDIAPHLTKDNYIGGNDGAVILQCDESETYLVEQGYEEISDPNPPVVPATKDKLAIITEIFDRAEKTTQLLRFYVMFNKFSLFMLALDLYDYNLARTMAQQALDEGDIIQDDYNLVDSILPPGV